ncbi:MAG: ribosomal-processing cysteine protease Prp [Spirochaetales bacterium]|nr:ribosomal-processing cysteine protease Prp [Spirochaetales bacterium]
MITISLKLSAEGIVELCKVVGHAGAGKKGEDIICAAVSVLIRTAGRTMEGKEGVTLEGVAPDPGQAGFRLISFQKSEREWLKGLCDGLVTGLLDVQEEYPEFCHVDLL